MHSERKEYKLVLTLLLFLLSFVSIQATYPLRVRHLLMELNRAVCLDHPEENIPWFHEKYCEEFLETGWSSFMCTCIVKKTYHTITMYLLHMNALMENLIFQSLFQPLYSTLKSTRPSLN